MSDELLKQAAGIAKSGEAALWSVWRSFLAAGHQFYLVWFLVAVTGVVIILLVTRPQPYDEYQTSILTNCLVIALILTFVAIALFFLIILRDPEEIILKFTLFVFLNWKTVVLANLVHVLLCRRR
jgi:hypothetical protein